MLVICHEFFDALPVMLFEKMNHGWVEKLVDNNIEASKEWSIGVIQKELSVDKLRYEQ